MKFERPFLAHSKPDHSPLSVAGELTVLLQSQEEAWRSGGLLTLEALEATLPKDETGIEQLMCLICNEVYLREQRGEKPELAEYQNRFPQLANALRIQWAVDELLDFHRSSLGSSEPQWTTPSNSRAPNAQKQSAHKNRLGNLLNGRYQLEREIGSGGMGVVYLANDTQLGREVAIKMLHSLKSRRFDTLSRFRAEAEILARVVHPHLVQVYDVGEADGEPFIVMEYCDAGSLADYLRGIPVEPRLAASWMQRIVDGVSAAHKIDVAHRDLKPSNILLTHSTKSSFDTQTQCLGFKLDQLDQLTAKISDFGLAKQVDLSQQLTVTGETIGTPAYMAPEQVGAQPGIDPKLSDVYSLGAVLYECLTGHHPFVVLL